MEKFIDLRSDTITRPSEQMRQAMYNAEVGDDVYKEDPTVNKLEEYVAELFGKEAALFVPSGTMANQICLNILTSPGDEVICDRNAHIFQYESGSPAKLSGLQLSLIDSDNGVFTAEQVEPLIRPVDAYYMARTRVVEIENTHNRAGGIINPIENIKNISQMARKHNLYMHLDGARIWNAHVETGVPLAEYASHFDTVSACFSKGLGAPIGSAVIGSKKLIHEAFRVRKSWGGGMRQAGVIAAASLYAVQNNIPRLKEDHQKAKMFAEGISKIEGVFVNPELVETNIVMFKPVGLGIEEFLKRAQELGLLLGTGKPGDIRVVTHMDVTFEEIEKVVRLIQKIFA